MTQVFGCMDITSKNAVKCSTKWCKLRACCTLETEGEDRFHSCADHLDE